jgi:hypothetical protein
MRFFGLEEHRQGGQLLLASISDSTTREGGLQLPSLQLPRFKLGKLGARSAATGASSNGKSWARHGSPRGPSPQQLAHAGAELQKVLALVGGVVIAGVSQAAQRMSRARVGAGPLPFHQSFKLPWTNHTTAARR